MDGLKNDMIYLKKLVEQVNSGDRNVVSVSGVIKRIENQIKDLDENVIENARLILEFRRIKKSIREKTSTDILKDIENIEQMIDDGVDSPWTGGEICIKIDQVNKKISKIDKSYDIRHELENLIQQSSRRFFSELAVKKLAKELKEKFS